jgi:hypothetical protein
LTIFTTVKEENGQWAAEDILDTPQGQFTDATVMEKGTLLVRKIKVSQGPVGFDIAFDHNKANGTMSMNGDPKPVTVDLGGPVFADAAGSDLAIACLPLAEGYTTTYRNFDLRRQKEKLWQLKVVGTESVTVAAGTFNAFKIQIDSADGAGDHQTLWIAKDSRKPVKASAVLADMGGATMTEELQ